MGILILLTILWILVQLGGLLLQEAEVRSISYGGIGIQAMIKNRHSNSLFIWAVKLLWGSLYMLNFIITTDTPEGVKTNFISTDIHTYWG